MAVQILESRVEKLKIINFEWEDGYGNLECGYNDKAINN